MIVNTALPPTLMTAAGDDMAAPKALSLEYVPTVLDRDNLAPNPRNSNIAMF